MKVSRATKSPPQLPGAYRERGYTLIEMMIVVVMIAIAGQLAMTSYADNVDRGRVSTAMTDIRTIEVAITKFYVKESRYPDDLAEAFQSVPGSCPKGKKTLLCDPWYTAYTYKPIEFDPLKGKCKGCRVDRNMQPLNSDFDLYSKGKDTQSALQIGAAYSEDDIIRVRNGNQIALGKDL